MPSWVCDGFTEYQKRLPKTFSLELVEIPAIKRYREHETNKVLDLEADKIIKQLKPAETVVALDRLGKQLSTLDLAQHCQQWHDHNVPIAIIIGGAEGIADKLLKRADLTWSLSALTFPHPLVRIVLAEQIYRAYSINTNHPYHR
jgi:23S rRNA (pseudouridine1915-N3)-methyltransferase